MHCKSRVGSINLYMKYSHDSDTILLKNVNVNPLQKDHIAKRVKIFNFTLSKAVKYYYNGLFLIGSAVFGATINRTTAIF